MASVLQHTEREYGRDFRPMPAQIPPLSLAPLDSHSWRAPEPAPDSRADRMVAYIGQLNATTPDLWRFEMAEGEEYRRGLRHFAKLWALQVDLDPRGFIWRSVAPEGFGVAQARVVRAAS